MAKYALTIFAYCLGFAVAVPTRVLMRTTGLPSFDSFMKAHERDFQIGTAEYEQRKGIYDQRVEDIRRHNADPTRLWTAGVNHFADRTAAEFEEHLGWRHHGRAQRNGVASVGNSMLEVGRAKPFNGEESDEHSWMNLSVASVVPNQGGCGSCWAVSTAEMLKAHDEIQHGKARSFSAQDLISCVKNPLKCGGAGGCEGATIELAMDYVMNNGLRTTDELPYRGSNAKCNKETIDSKMGKLDEDGRELNFERPVQQVSMMEGHGHGLGGLSLGLKGYVTLPKNKFPPLKRALIEHGPVGVTVAAANWGSYSSGVFNNCDNVRLNHAVVLFGMGKEGNHKFYLIKNSWGGNWGEQGFIRLLQNDNEEAKCATDDSPAEGVACEGGPSSVLACGTCGILYDNVYPLYETRP